MYIYISLYFCGTTFAVISVFWFSLIFPAFPLSNLIFVLPFLYFFVGLPAVFA